MNTPNTKKLGSVSGQTNLSIYYSPPCESTPTCVTYAVLKRDEDGYDPCGPLYETKKRDTEYCDPNTAYWSSDLFGFYTTPTNVTVEMTGYFLPPQTGSYTFKFATVDDSAILSVGGATAFDCCAQQQPPITSTDFTINGIKPWGGSLPPNVEGTVYMYAGFYYPMKVVYSNAVSWGTLPISVTLPDGTAISDDFEGYVYSFDDDLTQSDCTIPDPSNYTITGLITTTTEPCSGSQSVSASGSSSSFPQSASSTFGVSSSGSQSVSSASGSPSSFPQSASSAFGVSSSVSQSASSTFGVSSSGSSNQSHPLLVAQAHSLNQLHPLLVSQALAANQSHPLSGSQAHSLNQLHPLLVSQALGSQSVSSASGSSSSFPQSTSSASTASGSSTSNSLSSITSSASSASATASNSLSSSDGTIYLPTTTISGDLTLTGKVIATEGVVVAAGAKLTLLDGDKYSFSADLKVYGDLLVKKSKETYPGTEFDISGENFDVTGNFNAEESAATSASIYSFTPSSFDNSGDISLSLSKSKKGEVTFSPYSNSGAFSFSNAILNGGSVSGLQRRDDTEGSVNNGEINLDNGSTYVIVEPVSGKGTVNIISGNLYLHYPDTFTGQTVVFKGEGVLAVDPTESNTTPIPVVGYTGENQIAITADVTALSYDSATGVLTATQGNSQFFSIGTGFSSSGFNVSEGTFAGASSAYYPNYTSGATHFRFHFIWCSLSPVQRQLTPMVTSIPLPQPYHVHLPPPLSLLAMRPDVMLRLPVLATETVSSKSYTTATVTHCDDNGCNTKTVTSESKETSATLLLQIYTTVTVTHCDDNGCNTKTVTSEAPEATTTTVSPKTYTTATVTQCDDNGCSTKTVTSECPKKLQQLHFSKTYTTATLLTVTTTAVTLRLSPLGPEATTTTVSPKTYTTATVTQCDDHSNVPMVMAN
ncbi:Cell wall protein AWA1 [Saccharomyces cerevisiae]|nr:Cell wall protein AWA1 [Saccharomyces cerevisiae]